LFDPIEALVANWTPTMTHNLSINGKSGKTMYNIGLGMLDQTGMVKPAAIDDFKRYNASLSVTSEINKYITVTAGALYSDRNKRYPSVGSINGGDPWLYAYRWGPMFPVGCKDQFGRVMRTADQDFIQTTTSSLRNIYSQINLGTTINITKDWNVEFNYTHNTQENITEYSIPLFAYADSWVNNANLQQWYDENGERVYVDENGNYVYSSHTDDKGDSVRDGMAGWTFGWLDNWRANNAYAETSSISRRSRLINSNTYNLLTRYNLKLQEQHDFTFLAGMKIVGNKWTEHFARRTELTDFENPQFNFATGEQTVSGDSFWDAEAGFFGRVNYAFNNKYLFEGNLYYGGSSKFPEHLRWKIFPSFSAGWVITQESFMDVAKQFLSFAKLRASWGQLGDQTVNNNLYVAEINNYTTGWLGSNDLLLSYRAPAVVSSDIKWQTIETINLGLDTRFWRNRIGLTFEWFERTTKDMIISGDALPYTFGASAPQGNYGDLRTRGWEIVIDYNQRFSNGLGISVLATLFDAVIETTKGADHRRPWEERSIASTYATGARHGDVWGYISDGLYQEGDFVKDPNTVSGLKKTTIVIEGVSKESYELTGRNPVYQTRLEDGGGVVIFRPGDCKFKDLDGDGYITPGNGTFGNPGDRKVIGNTTPRYEYGVRVGADYKGFDFSIFVQGIGSRQMWGSGPLAIPGWYTADGSMPQAFAGDYWRPDRTDAFYPRAWDGGQLNTSYSMQQQSKYMLNMAYTRIKNITLGYTLPAELTKNVFVKKARIYASLENFFTFDNLRGLPLDPEVVSGYSMFNSTRDSYGQIQNNANLSRTGVGTPSFKSASVGCSISF
jgi:TonB-linked SusC/RagA family outer membrane protein